MMRRRNWAIAIGSAALIACSSTDSGAPSGGDGGPGAITTAGDSGELIDAGPPVTLMIGESGGTVTAPGIVLTFPAGALASDTAITITPTGNPVPTDYTGLTPLYVLGPSGTILTQAATVDFTFASTPLNPTILLSNASGGYDALDTTASSTTASAAILHLGDIFVGGTPSTDDGGSNPSQDAAVPQDSGASQDAGGVHDAGSIADSGSTDAGSKDSGVAPTDAGAQGITVTIGGVATTFAANPQLSITGADTSLPVWTVQADDNSSGTHWHLQIVVSGTGTQNCAPFLQPTYPQITYTHFTNGTLDQTYSTHTNIPNVGQHTCTITPAGNAPTAPGDQATGTFSGTLYGTVDGGAPLTFATGSFDAILP